MIQMSATFYPATQGTRPPSSIPELHLQKEDRWEYVPDMPEVNLANSNARFMLEKLGMDPHFEESDTSAQHIGDFILACQRVIGDTCPDLLRRGCPDETYELFKVTSLLNAALLGRMNGATHWYFA